MFCSHYIFCKCYVNSVWVFVKKFTWVCVCVCVCWPWPHSWKQESGQSVASDGAVKRPKHFTVLPLNRLLGFQCRANSAAKNNVCVLSEDFHSKTLNLSWYKCSLPGNKGFQINQRRFVCVELCCLCCSPTTTINYRVTFQDTHIITWHVVYQQGL